MILIRTMLCNLLKNAVEAPKAGDEVQIEINTNKKQICIRNTQTVPSNIRDRFFSKYVTEGKEDGTGLGTYSAQLIAKTHNARLTMETDDQTGITLSLLF